jgi:hypothetical protein
MKTPRFLAAAPLALLLAACGGGQTGKITLMLTDAPASFKAAVVTISEVDLVGSSGVTVLTTQKKTTNLLTLSNDVATLLADVAVEPGTYSELRFVISGAYVEVEQAGGGSVIYASSPTYEGLPAEAVVGGTLRMPSFGQSGLKVTLPGGSVTVGTESKVLLVDFDVAQSFGQEAGASGAWVMHPVMTAVDFGLSGTLDVSVAMSSGAALPAGTTLGQFSAVLTNSAGSSKTLALASGSGGAFTATFKYLIPGSYTLSFTAPASVATFATTPLAPATVTVSSGQLTAASFVVTSAQ